MNDEKQELVVRSNQGIVESSGWTPEQIDLIRNTVAQGTNDDEFKLYLYQASKMGLDPLAKQIHAVMRWDSKQNRNVMSIQTAIDGYRLIADRTGHYAGSDEPKFVEGKPFPVSATVTVYKVVGGIRCPFTATAFWAEYYPGDKAGFFWKKMPHGQLAKCAEALALRKAFPAELSGVYTKEEMEQAEVIYDAKGKTIEPSDGNEKQSTPNLDKFYNLMKANAAKLPEPFRADARVIVGKKQELTDEKLRELEAAIYEHVENFDNGVK